MSLDGEARADVPSVRFDVNQVAPLGSHWSMVDAMQAKCPWFWTTYAHGHWVLTDPVAIREAFQAPDLFSSISEVAAEPNPSYTFIPTNVDPPLHVKYRQILNPPFTPASIERLAPEAERICTELIDGFIAEGGCDFMADFASAYPTAVFLHSLGLPVDDTKTFAGWVRDIFDNFRHPDLAPVLNRALDQVRAYFTSLIADRRTNPRDPAGDFVSHLLASSIDDRPLTDDEILNISVVLLMAGIETTTGQLGFMFEHLASHPEARRRIVEDPDVIPTAVEEFLRAHSIILPGRKLTRDADFHGCPMKKGDMVMLPIPAANRSPEMFADPTALDFDRAPNRHIAFGAGPHRCLGIHLARRELATALRLWHERIPDYRVAAEEPLLERGGTLGLVSLPLAWIPRRAAEVDDRHHMLRNPVRSVDVTTLAARPTLRALAPALVAFVTGVLPLFLTGTLATQLRSDLSFSSARLGMAFAAFFGAAALASTSLGWMGERLGAGRALRLGAGVSGLAMAAIAVFATSWTGLAIAMAVAGAAQALIEPAANLYLARTVDPSRLGFAFGVKQAAVPAATLLGGLAVPVIAIPFGWRWVFVMGALVALGAVLVAPAPQPVARQRKQRDGDMPMRPLVILAVGVGLAGAAAATVAAFVVDSATDAGISAAQAGWLAALGGALGVITRVTSGLRADRRIGGHLRIVCQMLAVGVVVYLVLALGTPVGFAIAMPAAYVTAWGWPALLHLAVVRGNPRAPSAATGIINTGAFVGSVAGPLGFGWLVEQQSYSAAWVASAVWSLGGVLTISYADRLIGIGAEGER